jgi:hypothetical protein
MADTNKNDVVFTPPFVAEHIVKKAKQWGAKGRLLDPFKGNGAFYDAIKEHICPDSLDWCEITEGRDFFDYKERADWIISNPPYSTFGDVLERSFMIANNIIYLIPINKVWCSDKRVRMINEWGGVRRIARYTTKECGFRFGYSLGAVHFEFAYRGPIEFYPNLWRG